MTSSNRCIVCLNDEAHDHDANGVCSRCVYVNFNVYEEVLALVSPVGGATN